MSLLVVTGAGVSAASGIPMFRAGEDAVWDMDVLEKGTVAFFHRDPVASWKWYRRRFAMCADPAVRPNPAHHAIAEIERRLLASGDEFLLVTQNVDGLHPRAGSGQVVQVHGSAWMVRCSRRGCPNGAPCGAIRIGRPPYLWLPSEEQLALERFDADPVFANLPRCRKCRALLRPHVLWFDEDYGSHDDYEIARVRGFAAKADDVLFVGTSFAVGVTDMVMRAALDDRPWGTRRKVPARVTIVDPSPVAAPASAVCVRAKAEEWLPENVGSFGGA